MNNVLLKLPIVGFRETLYQRVYPEHPTKPTLSDGQVLHKKMRKKDMDRTERFVYDFPDGVLGLIMVIVILAFLVKFTT
jgi:hypothetical protein